MVKQRGFGLLTCPLCAAEAEIRISLCDLDSCTCPECNEDFGLDNVRDMLARWQRVLCWVEAVPLEGPS